MLLLDATFSKIRKISRNIRNSHHCENEEKLSTVRTLVDVLKDVIPEGPEKPVNISVWYSDENHCLMFTFKYTYEETRKYGIPDDSDKDFTLDEFYQYFCDLLGDKWISLEDKKPLNNQIVLTLIERNMKDPWNVNKSKYGVEINKYYEERYEGDRKWTYEDNECKKAIRWQPLPELPKDLR